VTTIALKVRLVHRTKYNTFGPNDEPFSLKLITLLFGYKTKELEGFWTTNHLLSPFHAGPFFDISFCMWLPCFKHGTKSKKRITMFLALFASCACSRILSWVTIYLWSKVVCFVFSHWDLPNHALDVVLLISLESSWWVRLHWLGLRLFGTTVWELLIIESFSQWNKIKTENCIGIWGCSSCYWKALGESDLIKFISQFSERYWFLSTLCCWKFKQMAKIGFGWMCSHLGPQFLHIAKKNYYLILKM